MASLRRTKNFASDGQTPIFLYTILKQLDLRSIDWNLVASSLDISNGHAARMRYSRMKQQFEGQSNQPKPPKAKKEKDGEGKSTKEKGKGKRLLLEEENERLAKQRNSTQNDVKKPRLEPSAYIEPAFTSSSIVSTGQQYTSPMWNQLMVKIEPASEYASLAGSHTSSAPVIKEEPNTSTSVINMQRSTSPIVKQEPTTTPMTSHEMSAATPITIKQEADTAMSYGAFTGMNPLSSSSARSYHLPNMPGRYMNGLEASHYMNSYGLPMGASTSSSGYTMPQSAPGYAYHPFMYQPSNRWPQAAVEHSVTNSMSPTADNISLNPLASSYEELLNMPLYVRHATPAEVQIPEMNYSRHAPAQPIDSRSEDAQHASRSANASGLGTKDNNIKAGNANPGVNSTHAPSSPDSALANLNDATSRATIETDFDADCEIDTAHTGMADGNDTRAVAVKREPVEAW
ncbi:hypothetical protein A1O1_03917 [Capronia coronata CBS 617.96]|uniref:Myb-like DNA-binding domain-containing protein n=1 Tax=Capronia coronata CBS 617.96 TaxID=1182541 RepID=W9YD57_9EURO|nr:uncharacterized protein A1O1_03917 [Capronia coronata CBS 617.96]EXJ90812.1 hypothetical protein A1O1_03917 [Capronia coronata CBS 617.96]